jgi:CSLREA domain-containing protein
VRTLLALALLASAAPSLAVDFVVDSTADAPDAAIDGTCADADGGCTLRAALQEANATPADADTIALPAGKFVLKRTGAFEDAAATGDLDVLGPVQIDGAGPEATIVQGKKDRVFDVFAAVQIADLTITKGKAPKSEEDDEASGGGIRNVADLVLTNVHLIRNAAADDSGAITNEVGTLTLNDVLLSRNKAGDDAGALDNDGGTVTLSDVTFEKNKAKDEAGAFESEEGGVITGTNVTISGNRAREAGGANAEQDGVVDLTNATIVRNKCKIGGCGVQNEDTGSFFVLVNSIVADNPKVNCQGPISAEGGNVDSGSTCGFAAPDDLPNAGDVGLSPKLVVDDGAPGLPYHAVAADSPAIDFAVDAECPTLDVRGTAREDVPDVGASVCDSGAVEFHAPL